MPPLRRVGRWREVDPSRAVREHGGGLLGPSRIVAPLPRAGPHEQGWSDQNLRVPIIQVARGAGDNQRSALPRAVLRQERHLLERPLSPQGTCHLGPTVVIRGNEANGWRGRVAGRRSLKLWHLPTRGRTGTLGPVYLTSGGRPVLGVDSPVPAPGSLERAALHQPRQDGLLMPLGPQMHLGWEVSPTSAEGPGRRVPPFAPAACWCARTMVLSTRCRAQASRPSASACRRKAARTRSQTPAFCQREKRLETVFQEP